MNDCQCNIPNGGWCERHQVDKGPNWVRLCRTRPPYWNAWEKGTGPGQRRNGKGVKGFRGGPGTELHNILASCGIKEDLNCECRSRRRKMNKWGPDKCREELSTIVDWMELEAKRRNMVFNRLLARLIVRRAIARARRVEKKWRAANKITLENS